MEKGKLAKWLKAEGDEVRSGDVIAEIETDKATMEVEAVDEGRLGKIMIPEGTDDVAVNTPIAMILAAGEDASAIAAPMAGAKPAWPSRPKRRRRRPRRHRQSQRSRSPPSRSRLRSRWRQGRWADLASPLARRLAKEAGIDIRLLKGSGPNGPDRQGRC